MPLLQSAALGMRAATQPRFQCAMPAQSQPSAIHPQHLRFALLASAEVRTALIRACSILHYTWISANFAGSMYFRERAAADHGEGKPDE